MLSNHRLDKIKSWTVTLENPEEMFPLLGWGEIPNRVNMLLDGTKYLHVQFNDCLYQFKDPHRENVLRNIH